MEQNYFSGRIDSLMLELKHIKKTYKAGEIETKALDDISVAFRQKEFVAILGTSGSGKTTFLNILGGLDRYDSGELVIKGKKTSDFKDKEWDAYRNNSVGFIFQSYNLIMHISIVENVELGMTLSGVSAAEKHKRAVEVLKEVGLGDHLHKKPNQLSGGQMQRVAIARALANDPEILLCDEPTGALDTQTSIQIMELIKEVAKDRLVIMVTHNPQLAHEYADRIIEFKDGHIISDNHPHEERPKEDEFKLKKTSMNFLTALKLSFNNIRTKKGRTFLTSFASSIGIIGIAVILSLSSGFKEQVLKYQNNALSEYPVMISRSMYTMDEAESDKQTKSMMAKMNGTVTYEDTDKVKLYDSAQNSYIHKNNLSDDYMNYLNNISPDICKSISYTRIVNMNVVRKDGDKIIPATFKTTGSQTTNGEGTGGAVTSTDGIGLTSYPDVLRQGSEPYIKSDYDLLAGSYPESDTDLMFVIDTENRADYTILKALGFDTDNVDSIPLDDIVGTEFKIVSNDDYYSKTPYGTYAPGNDYEAMYNSDKSITVRIAGVVRVKPTVTIGLLGTGIVYSDSLAQKVIDNAENSQIVKAQENSDKNIITMEDLDKDGKEQMLSYLGGNATPYMIMVFPDNFNHKDEVLKYLDSYNDGKDKNDQVLYVDLASSISDMTGGIMDGITIVLVAFAAISLVVSLIMICIITYTSVLERTKEIGILRALGARKKDITRVFDAETFILGVFSGVLGIVIAWALTFPINSMLYNMTEMKNVAQLKPSYAVILVIVSTLLTVLGGHIPAKMASKKDAVEALRAE